jgi:site-specific recombinase XerD
MARPKKEECAKGFVFKRKDSAGRIQFWLAVWFNGARQNIKTDARNVTEADAELIKAQARVAAGLDPVKLKDSPVILDRSFGRLLDEWLAHIMEDVPERFDAEGRERWAAGRYRGAKQDHYRKNWLRTAFSSDRQVSDLEVHDIVDWIGRLRTSTSQKGTFLSQNSQYVIYYTLSRFFSWCVGERHMKWNPCMQVPKTLRPEKRASNRWLETPEHFARFREAIELMRAAGEETAALMTLTGHMTGMRLGEIVGLRLSDLEWTDQGAIRVRYNGPGGKKGAWGPLKEDKDDEGKCKFVVAPDDLVRLLRVQAAKRKLNRASDEDYLFVDPQHPELSYRADRLSERWRAYRRQVGLGEYCFYAVTRHTFATTMMDRGATLGEIAEALNHMSMKTTRIYVHRQRPSYSEKMRQFAPTFA